MTLSLADDRDPRWIPGAQGYADDIRRHAAAYAQAEPDGPPDRWVPEYVAQRFAAAVKAGGRWHGPQTFATCWPAMLVEFSDLVDRDARANVEHEKAIEYDDLDEPDPDARLMTPTLAEEALRWPMLYLRDEPRASVSLMIWAMGLARLIRVAPLLRRIKLAEKRVRIIAGLQERLNSGPPLCADERKLVELWRAKVAEMKPDEAARCRSDIARIAAGEPYVKSRTTLDRDRKRAAAIICGGLERDAVRVR